MKKNVLYMALMFGITLSLILPVTPARADAKTVSAEKPYVIHAESAKTKLTKVKTIHSSGGSDTYSIREALDTYGKVKLAKGETFHISSTLMLQDGDYINATGATIICEPMVLVNHEITDTDYSSLKNVTIKGGTWRSSSDDGYTKTSFHFTHAKNIKLINMDVKVSNYEGHTFEFVACENVTMKNCTVMPCGKAGTSSVEEQIQLDIATGTTYPAISGTEFANGACCRNIKIVGCTVKGNRAVCANYSRSEDKYIGNMHSGITVTGCTLTGECSEALALFNTYSATVKNNTIITKAPVSRDSYSIGCHFHFFGNNKSASEGKITVTDNLIKGGRQALQFYSHSDTQFGTVTISGNKLYCRNGKDKALLASCITKSSTSDNKTYDWDGK